MNEQGAMEKEDRKHNVDYKLTLQHGVPKHSYFVIFMPKYTKGGQSDWSMGVGQVHTLVNPQTSEEVKATLINRDVCYTVNSAFDALAFSTYGVSGGVVLDKMVKQYPDMVNTVVEVWIFKKEE